MRMGLFGRWRRSRGTVMRKEYDDVIARMRKADDHALESFYTNVDQTAEPLKGVYVSASPKQREAILKECRQAATEMWNSGDWPASLGLAITALNVESEFVRGKDAAYVNAGTNRIISDAARLFERKA
jgi:hypothetical protein